MVIYRIVGYVDSYNGFQIFKYKTKPTKSELKKDVLYIKKRYPQFTKILYMRLSPAPFSKILRWVVVKQW